MQVTGSLTSLLQKAISKAAPIVKHKKYTPKISSAFDNNRP